MNFNIIGKRNKVLIQHKWTECKCGLNESVCKSKQQVQCSNGPLVLRLTSQTSQR